MRRPIITPQAMAAAEQAVFQSGTDSFAVMRIAGEGVAEALHRTYPAGDIAVLCGPGGNGGDGFVAAAWLASQGRSVQVFSLKPVGRLGGDAARAAALWTGPVHPLADALSTPTAVTLDALFGGGLSRPLEGPAADLACQGRPVLVSVDVPSGIDGAAAAPLGPAFTAHLTVTFAALRPAHAFKPARTLCGTVEIIDIGVPIETKLWQVAQDALEACPSYPTAERVDAEWLEAFAPYAAGDASRTVDALRSYAKEKNTPVLYSAGDMLLVEPGGDAIVGAASTMS